MTHGIDSAMTLPNFTEIESFINHFEIGTRVIKLDLNDKENGGYGEWFLSCVQVLSKSSSKTLKTALMAWSMSLVLLSASQMFCHCLI